MFAEWCVARCEHNVPVRVSVHVYIKVTSPTAQINQAVFLSPLYLVMAARRQILLALGRDIIAVLLQCVK